MIEQLARSKRWRVQQRISKAKVYDIFAPELACIAKDKAQNPS